MRKVNKNRIRIPQKLESKACLDRINDSIQNAGIHKYSNAYYADGSVHKQLKKMYGEKCAFCESKIGVGSAIQVDHYRPKNGVIEDSAHRGYYWLGYEWTNLISICSKCNRSKSHHFPIGLSGNRVYTHPVDINGEPNKEDFKIISSILQNEKPQLINPEIQNPQNYFTFLPSGKLKGKGQVESDTTIEIFKLNRHNLRIARKKIRDDLLKDLTRTLTDFRIGDISPDTAHYQITRELEKLLAIYTENGQYSMYVYTMLIHFNYFIARRFKNRDNKFLTKVYDDFLDKCRQYL